MKTIISNCHVVDVRAGQLLHEQNVVIEGGSIVAVSADEGAPPGQPEELRIDAGGGFLLPGLIDMHVHCCDNARVPVGGKSVERLGSTAEMAIQAVENLRTALAVGITTVRDLGGPDAMFDVKRAWHHGRFTGARPLVAGPMLTAIGGHGTEGGSAIGFEICGADEMRRAVRTLIARGADVIKVVTSGLVVTTELTRTELEVAVEEAHWCGIRVASHANFGLRGICNSIDAGCDSIEHCCVPNEQALKAMAQRQIAMCPTITILARILERPDVYGETSRLTQAAREVWPKLPENLALARSLGVPIIAGTDAGMTGVEFDSLLDELDWMVQWGMPPMEALRCATSTAADALGRADLGEVAPGKSGDLVLLGRDPTSDLSALRDQRAVFLAGQLIHAKPDVAPGVQG